MQIPSFIVPSVRVVDIETVMEVMEDLNPIHVDEELAKSLGLRGCVNQGPANIGYIVNMFVNWLGDPTAIKNLQFRNYSISCPGDYLESRGEVLQVDNSVSPPLLHCSFALVRPLTDGLDGNDVEVIAAGTAVVESTSDVNAYVEGADA